MDSDFCRPRLAPLKCLLRSVSRWGCLSCWRWQKILPPTDCVLRLQQDLWLPPPKLRLQSRRKTVENFALSYSQQTYHVNLTPWWPLPPPFPGQCCLVVSKNVSATLQHCCFWGEGEVSWMNPALEGSILKLDIHCAFFLTFLSTIVFSSFWRICLTVNIWSEM